MFRAYMPLAMFLCLGFTSRAAEQPSAEQIEKWAVQLADDDFSKRVAAEDALRGAGETARPVLEKTSLSSDTEAKARATRLLKTLKTEPILKKMLESTVAAKSVEAELDMSMKMMNMNTVMKGHFKGTGDGKKMVMDMNIGVAGQMIPAHIVGDGTNFWSEITMPGGGQKMVQKFSAATMEKMGGGSQNPLQGVKELRDRFVFTDVKDEKLGDADVFVLEGRIKEGVVERQTKIAEEIGGAVAAQAARQQLELMDRSRIYVDKKTYMVRKSEVMDAGGQVIVSIELNDIKLDTELDDKVFHYTPPGNAQVMDMEEQFKKARAAGNGMEEDK
jgi:hypothetical protein